MEVVIKDLSQDDIDLMAVEIRAIDAMEFDLMSGGKSVDTCLEHLNGKSMASRAAYVDGALICVYGVISPTLLSTTGNPWLCATDQINRPEIRKRFIQMTKPEMVRLCSGFDKLWNIVAEENRMAVRWLKWIGFKFDGSEYVIQGHKFLKFHMGE